MLKYNKCLLRNFCENIKNNLEQDFLKLDYYSILNINKNASDSDIKKSYFILAKKFHPDKFKGSPEIFKKISDAYNTLRDTNKREDYNKKMKYKMKRKHKREKEKENMNYKTSAETQTEESEEKKTQENSKYEEEFKKMNIDKLFIQFTHTKIRTSPEEIKTFREDMEIKMTKREYKIKQFMDDLYQQEKKNKDISYQFFKNVGIIKEDTKPKENYRTLVRKEINRIKNKMTIKEEIKSQKKKEKEMSNEKDKSLQNMIIAVFGAYFLIIIYMCWNKYKNKKLEEEFKSKMKEDYINRKYNNYVYLGNKN